MNRRIVISIITLVVVISSFFIYTNFIKEYELIINGEVISKDTSLKLNKSIEKELQKYQEELVKSSRITVTDIEKKYNEKIDLTKSEKVKVKKISKYEYVIDVSHQVKRTMTEEISFTTSTVENPNEYNTYTSVQTTGVNGTETTSYTSTYVNGEFITFKGKQVDKVDPINEVVVVGTLQVPNASSNAYNSNNVYGGGTSSNAVATTGGGSTITTEPTNDCGYYNQNCGIWVFDYNNCTLNTEGTYDCPLIWKPN